MAMAFPWSTCYTCRVCGHVLDASELNLCNDYDDKIHQHLLDKCDMYGMYEYREEIKVNMKVPLTVNCTNSECESTIKVIAYVEAVPVWLECDPSSDKDVDVDTFELVEVSVIEFCNNRHVEEVQLRIICKAKMGEAASCYLGYNEETRRLYRPIRGGNEGNFSWPTALNEFRVGEIYSFRVLARNNSSVECSTGFPHQNEDIVVEEEQITAHGLQRSWTPSILEGIASSSIFDIFPEEFIKEMKYIDADTDCPSAGVLRVHENDINVYKPFEKFRVSIKNCGISFDFPLTATSFKHLMYREGSEQRLFCLG
ncbi:uncharacterized protein LOC123565083 [Mercenaria mercenaria]|uniref:uncharacterized protein LOC123565083 n=1 Tax=Mercenaria mercenaria TaxID=6596 RepID=UPI00234EA40F|nr:uncharacterized protein LOC123565083 [Mercenaria mercenaria]XP_053393601.1 uncharacterized protein LOC123565083 [Mercenaria mercenaria]